MNNNPTADAVAQIRCCGVSVDLITEGKEIIVDLGGASLANAFCSKCGTEYKLGVMVTTREAAASVAKAGKAVRESNVAAIKEIAGDDTDEIMREMEEDQLSGDDGLDIHTAGGSDSMDILMCALCDRDVRPNALCRGCKEYICQNCRKYPITRSPHPTSMHDTKPQPRVTSAAVIADEDDFSAEDDLL